MRTSALEMTPAHLRMWDEKTVELKARAIRERREGFHYKGFRVGAAALLYDPVYDRYNCVEGSNFKSAPGTKGARVCAEETPLSQAVLRRCLIVGMMIAGDYQPDDQTGLPFMSLLPCVHCRTKFRILHEDTGLMVPETKFESMRIAGTDGDEEIVRSLPFNFESLFAMAPVTEDDVREARRKYRPNQVMR